MPHLNIQVQFPINVGGQQVALPPEQALIARGPVAPVSVSILTAMGQQLVQAGKTLPKPINGEALIDTGASMTCIDDAAAQAMGLPIINQVQMHSASHAAQTCNVYPVSFSLAGSPMFNVPMCAGAQLVTQGLLLLIGRDILSQCTMFYNGSLGIITLTI